MRQPHKGARSVNTPDSLPRCGVEGGGFALSAALIVSATLQTFGPGPRGSLAQGDDHSKGSTMNRRSACLCFLAVAKTSLLSSFAWAAGATAKTVSRVAGPHWSVNGDWNPGIEAVQKHLRAAHGIDPTGLGLEELLALHDNSHNRMGSHGHSHQRKPQGITKGYGKF